MPAIKRNTPTISVKKILKLSPKEISKVHPDNFVPIRAKDIAHFTEEQILAFTPEQIKTLRPISFSEVDIKVLEKLLNHLEQTIPNEPYDRVVKKVINPQGKEVERAFYGAKETIRLAIPKAKKMQEEKRKWEKLRQQDGLITRDHILADVVAAKLDISVRFLYMLSEPRVDNETGETIPAEIIIQKESNKLVCLKQSVIDYLNRQRVPGAKLDEYGNPILQPKELDKAKPNLKNYVPVDLKPLTDIPILYSVEHFAERLEMNARSFIRNCNLGQYDHFRIGSVLKMSEEDFERSIKRRTEVAIKASESKGRKPRVEKLVSNGE
ncbi:hypothetical protein JK635_07935 [Neobacillus sp. YIM B02564]|uniref:Uncharacterized protein n=1 Tax=Neobacillus paridis TaxID=2803862 RepID=A0ABS1TQH3_9BACI|nr:hypothetical protein [Neobacillus paridis]MBL4952140.1 hypothetical protein [Neobacillus paridis]